MLARIFLNIKKDYLSEATIKIERLQFSGPLLQPNFLKVEIDYQQNVLLTPKPMKYNNVWGLDFGVQVMDVKEICAGKIRAMSDRARYRDCYDLYLLQEAYSIDFHEVVAIIGQKEIRQSITKANVTRNWELAGTQKATEMSQIHYSKAVEGEHIQVMIGRLPFTVIVSSTSMQ